MTATHSLLDLLRVINRSPYQKYLHSHRYRSVLIRYTLIPPSQKYSGMHSAKQHNQQKCHHARSTQTMMRNTMARKDLTALAATAYALTAFSVSAAPKNWADWTTGQTTGAGFQAQNNITTPSSTIIVTYTNPQGISFFQPSGGIDYYQNRRSNVLIGRDPAASPYTSAQVDNIP